MNTDAANVSPFASYSFLIGIHPEITKKDSRSYLIVESDNFAKFRRAANIFRDFNESKKMKLLQLIRNNRKIDSIRRL